MNSDKEKREKTRVNFKSEATFQAGETVITGPIVNLSMKGLFLKTESKLPDQTSGIITIKLSGSSTDLSIKINAVVIRVDGNGLAVAFQEMELDSFIHLRNIVHYADTEFHDFMEFG